MPNLLRRGQVQIENLGGETRTLAFKSETFAAIEEELGSGIADLMSEEKVGFRTIAHLIWAACLHEDPRLTPVEVLGWIDEVESLADLTGLIMPAVKEAMPGGKKLYAERQKEAAKKPSESAEKEKTSSSQPTA